MTQNAKDIKDFTHCETWTTRFGYNSKKDICSFEFLQKTSHVLQTVGNKNDQVRLAKTSGSDANTCQYNV